MILNEMQKKWLAWGLVALAILIASALGVTYPMPAPPLNSGEIVLGESRGIGVGSYRCNYALGVAGNNDCFQANNGYDISIYADAAQATRTIWMEGALGDITASGVVTASQFVGGAGASLSSSYLRVAGPTAATTATPVALIDNLGAANDALVVSKAGTPVAKIGNSGNTTLSGLLSANAGAFVVGPTAAASATPAAYVNNTGAANDALLVAKAGTPIAKISNSGDGTFTGYLSAYYASLAVPTAAATATPGLYVNNLGAANDAIVAAKAATPVFKVSNLGSISAVDMIATSVVSGRYLTASVSLAPNQVLPSSSGSAASAIYCMSGDCDTGLYYVGDNTIGVTAGGVQQLQVDTAGLLIAQDIVLAQANTSFGMAPAPQAANTAGNSMTLTGGQAGAASGDADGRNGGSVNLTGGLGTVLSGAGTNDGNGGNVVLLGGARGGATGTAVQGIVQVGTPSVASARTVDLLAVAGGLEVDGAARFDGNVNVSAGTLTGPAEGSVVYNVMHDVTAAEINAGHTIVTVPAARQARLVDARATAYGGTCTTSTSVYLKGGSNVLATYTVANLVQSTLLNLNSTGVAVAPDGASFTAQTAGDDVTIISDTNNTAGCTGVRFVLSYALD